MVGALLLVLSTIDECVECQAGLVGPLSYEALSDGHAFGKSFFLWQIFFAPLEVQRSELARKPQGELHLISSDALVLIVHELHLDFVAKVFSFPRFFEEFLDCVL